MCYITPIMKSLNINLLNSINFSIEQMATLKTIGECRGRQDLFYKQSREVIDNLRQIAIIESSESSNRIEGITVAPDRIEPLILKSTTPQNRSEQEVAGYRDALELVHESGKHMDLSVNIILQLHAMMYRYMPSPGGRWKPTDNEIVEKNSDGTVKRVRFKAVSAFGTPSAMDDLVESYKDAIDKHAHEPLVIIPLAILDFLCIHPFRDGNGRISRLLTLLLLYHFDYEVGRYISLERIFEETKETYYETLEKSSQLWHEGKHDVMPWLNYFWGVLLRAYREFEERVSNVKTGRGSKTDQIRQAIERKIGPFSITDIESEFPTISRDMIRLVFRKLKTEGKVKPQGRGRSAKWIKIK
jgi:Fic family protein